MSQAKYTIPERRKHLCALIGLALVLVSAAAFDICRHEGEFELASGADTGALGRGSTQLPGQQAGMPAGDMGSAGHPLGDPVSMRAASLLGPKLGEDSRTKRRGAGGGVVQRPVSRRCSNRNARPTSCYAQISSQLSLQFTLVGSKPSGTS